MKVTTKKEIQKQMLRGVIANSMQIEFMDFFRDTNMYKTDLKVLSRNFYGKLRNELIRESKAAADADEGVFGELIDAQIKSADSLGKISLESMKGISELLEQLAKYEKEKVKYKLNIEVLKDGE